MKSERAVKAERRRIWWASLNQATRTIILIGVVVLLVMAGFWLKAQFFGPKEPTITTDYITGKLDVASELTTAELTYTGVLKYEDGSIPFLTKKGYSMVYTATVKAGIDFSQIQVDVKKDSVVVTLPEAEIQSVYVNPNTIDFYDESFALFNWGDKTDITKSIAAAENDIQTNADTGALIDKSNMQTERLVRALLEDAIGDKKLIIKKEKKTQ